ncbi:unnamed protein product, partial [Effrenium voratum]
DDVGYNTVDKLKLLRGWAWRNEFCFQVGLDNNGFFTVTRGKFNHDEDPKPCYNLERVTGWCGQCTLSIAYSILEEPDCPMSQTPPLHKFNAELSMTPLDVPKQKLNKTTELQMGLLNTGNDKAMPTPAGSTLEKPGTLPRAKSKLVRSLIASGKNKLAKTIATASTFSP